MNNQLKQCFKKFLKQNKCYNSFKYYYNLTLKSNPRRKSLRYFLNKCECPAQAVFSAFGWSRAKEGPIFWESIYEKSKQLICI